MTDISHILAKATITEPKTKVPTIVIRIKTPKGRKP